MCIARRGFRSTRFRSFVPLFKSRPLVSCQENLKALQRHENQVGNFALLPQDGWT